MRAPPIRSSRCRPDGGNGSELSGWLPQTFCPSDEIWQSKNKRPPPGLCSQLSTEALALAQSERQPGVATYLLRVGRSEPFRRCGSPDRQSQQFKGLASSTLAFFRRLATPASQHPRLASVTHSRPELRFSHPRLQSQPLAFGKLCER